MKCYNCLESSLTYSFASILPDLPLPPHPCGPRNGIGPLYLTSRTRRPSSGSLTHIFRFYFLFLFLSFFPPLLSSPDIISMKTIFCSRPEYVLRCRRAVPPFTRSLPWFTHSSHPSQQSHKRTLSFYTLVASLLLARTRSRAADTARLDGWQDDSSRQMAVSSNLAIIEVNIS